MKVFEVRVKRSSGICIVIASSLEVVSRKYYNAYRIKQVYQLKNVHIIKEN